MIQFHLPLSQSLSSGCCWSKNVQRVPKEILWLTTIDQLIALTCAQKQHNEKDRCIAFQTDVLVEENDASEMLRPRTLEEAIVYENFRLLRSGALSIGITVRASLSDAYQDVYERVRSDNFKKTDFAMDILACAEQWIVPGYIAEGLKWLESRLLPPLPDTKASVAAENRMKTWIESEADIQVRACIDGHRSFAMIAGAGAGKTSSLVDALGRVRDNEGNVLRKHGQRIACITFTKRAVEVIKKRLGFDELYLVSTLHGFLWGLISHFHTKIFVKRYMKTVFQIL